MSLMVAILKQRSAAIHAAAAATLEKAVLEQAATKPRPLTLRPHAPPAAVNSEGVWSTRHQCAG
jgi:hypothetical protein